MQTVRRRAWTLGLPATPTQGSEASWPPRTGNLVWSFVPHYKPPTRDGRVGPTTSWRFTHISAAQPRRTHCLRLLLAVRARLLLEPGLHRLVPADDALREPQPCATIASASTWRGGKGRRLYQLGRPGRTPGDGPRGLGRLGCASLSSQSNTHTRPGHPHPPAVLPPSPPLPPPLPRPHLSRARRSRGCRCRG